MNLARLFLGTGRALVAAPARWRGAHWAFCVAFVATLAVAWADERPIQILVEGRGGAIAAAIARFANLTGSGTSVTVLGLGALLFAYFTRDDELVQATLVLAVAGLWALLLVDAGQFVLAEQRPLEGGAMRFLAPGGHGVSGHAAATALLVLPVRDVWLRRATPLSRHVAAASLSVWAAVVGWSRVWLGMHFAWNVLAGVAIGFWASSSAVAVWRQSGARERDRG
jgi:undecaprenyl-diphosphatase